MSITKAEPLACGLSGRVLGNEGTVIGTENEIKLKKSKIHCSSKLLNSFFKEMKCFICYKDQALAKNFWKLLLKAHIETTLAQRWAQWSLTQYQVLHSDKFEHFVKG